MTAPRTLLQARGLRARKKMGQHFLVEPATAAMIVAAAALESTEDVFEIGAGLGALTLLLAQSARRVVAVEKDAQIADLLQNEIGARQIHNVQIVRGDIMTTPILPFKLDQGQLVVMGNLPYNISSQILVKLVHERTAVSRAVLMIQKELAQRICAAPGGRDYGRLSVMLQYCCRVVPIAEVSAGQFFPPPKVASSVIELIFNTQKDTRKHYDVGDEEFFFRVIKAAFGQRRKTLKNALAGSELHLAPELAGRALAEAAIDARRRAETLTVSEFVRLAQQVQTIYHPT